MFYMESRHLLNLSVQNALHCISENFNHKNFRRDACARNSLERCAVRCPDRRYSAHIATIYYISRHPLSQNPLSAAGSILLDSFILHGRRQKTVIACLYIHILKLLKLWITFFWTEILHLNFKEIVEWWCGNVFSTSERTYLTCNNIQVKSSFGGPPTWRPIQIILLYWKIKAP